ncbi:hydroxymethylglutaryl-CoA reductase, degradative [Lacticaseibacillus jixianensis]|uniref:Hydroxymethylglutaryl-CoA reductase, degradative n=1 Tax=Lacticaseibacillus jixianensis TaxID=2486012 RepID=A0ABW4BCT2_9LACO|nr:hydroxymethylglutaryl-CoA reductase, degradative [Lacticaseibacillus jixianensis]
MTKFYELTPAARRDLLIAAGLAEADAAVLAAPGLSPDVAASLTENVIGQYALPLGVVRALTVNGQSRTIAMVTEEPSVIAAANNGARIVNQSGGVTATAAPHRVQAEVVFDDVPDHQQAVAVLTAHRAGLFRVAEAAHPSAVKRGGGLKDITFSQRGRFMVMVLTIAPSQAMGANLADTIAEAVAAAAAGMLDQPALVAILTNHSDALVQATVSLTPATLRTSQVDGLTIARRIAALSDLAQVDPLRAATHNKGIMNGIEAAVLATGNDTRAVAAAVAAYSLGRPLSSWVLTAGRMVGQLTLPLPVGVLGGAISALPKAQAALRLGDFQTVSDLQCGLAALGLVQNLAALRALAGPGIQAGHMALQAKALAIAAGASGAEIQQVAAGLSAQTRTLAAAKQLLANLRGTTE